MLRESKAAAIKLGESCRLRLLFHKIGSNPIGAVPGGCVALSFNLAASIPTQTFLVDIEMPGVFNDAWFLSRNYICRKPALDLLTSDLQDRYTIVIHHQFNHTTVIQFHLTRFQVSSHPKE